MSSNTLRKGPGISALLLKSIPIVLLFIFAFANLLHIKRLWGINFLAFYPPVVTYCIIILILPFLIPGFAREAMRIINKIAEYFTASKRSGVILRIVFLALMFILFLAFPSRTTYLGDGHLRTNQLQFGEWFLPTEFLDYFLHAGLYYIFQPLGLKTVSCYQIFSAICGLIFITGIWKLAGCLFPEQRAISFFTLGTSGIIVLFFGYIESYSLIAALLPFIFIAGLNGSGNSQKILPFAIIYFAGGLIHSIAFLLFAPALIFLLLSNRFKSKISSTAISKWMLGIIISLIALIYIARELGISSIGNNLLSITPGADSPQAIFTIRHLMNIINWLFIAAFPVFLFIPGLLHTKAIDSTRSPHRQFAIWISIPSLLFILLFMPKLGGPRDWDLFSLPAFLILLSILTLYSDRHKKQLPYGILSIILIAAASAIGFIAVNNSIAKATNRFAETIEVDKSGNLFNEYNLLNGYASDHPEIKDRWLEFAVKAWAQPPQNKRDSVLILNKLGEYYMKIGNPSEAHKLLSLSLQTDSLNLITYHYLINFYGSYGPPGALLKLAEQISSRFPDNARGLMDAGTLYIQNGQTERGSECLKQAYQIDSGDVFIVVNYAVYHLRQGNLKESLRLLTKAVQSYPDYYAANYNLALVYIGLGDRASAQNYLTRAGRLATTAADSAQIASMMHKINQR